MNPSLDAVEAARAAVSTPYIHRPDTLDIRDGTLCWLDGTRVCGADCTAFNTDDETAEGDVIQGPNRCLVLLYTGQQASAAMSALLASRASQRRDADKTREARGGGAPPSPDPYGRQR